MNQEREAVARIIRGWDLPPEGQRIGPGTKRAIIEADVKADAILALRSGGEGWRDISTAPRDGTTIDLWWREPGSRLGCRIANAYWSGAKKPRRGNQDGWWAPGHGSDGDCGYIGDNDCATHWRLPPPSPSTQEPPRNPARKIGDQAEFSGKLYECTHLHPDGSATWEVVPPSTHGEGV